MRVRASRSCGPKISKNGKI